MNEMEFNNEITLSWHWEDEDGDHDDGQETLIVNDYTEEDIKSCVDDYLNSKEFRYSDCNPRRGEFVHFFVEVQMVPSTEQKETLFSGTFIDGYIDWEEMT